MRTYKVIAVLLGYPERAWLTALPEFERVLEEEGRDNHNAHTALGPLLGHLRATPLLTLQVEYVDTFDRAPAHSLHLFEHIHGESRARGQAMADLVDAYAQRGLAISGRELPDYLPLFLEYVSFLSDGEAREWLRHVAGVTAAIASRLARQGSAYAAAFDVITRIAPSRASFKPAPARDMEQALAATQPAPDGVEPLLVPTRAQEGT